jgi:NAD(P)H-dependent FMN reductase
MPMSEDRNLFIPVLLGTVRAGRRSAHVAQYIWHELESRRGIDTQLIDLGEVDLPLMRCRLSESDSPPPGLVEFSDTLARADGLAIVAPEYKNGYPGALKNSLDYLNAGAFRRKPIGIVTVSSGGFGGLNCLAQLRLVCLAMGGVPIPIALPVSKVEEGFDDQGGLLDTKLSARMGPFLDELAWYTRAVTRQRALDQASGSS